MKKRVLSILLVLTLIIGMVPFSTMSAHAAGVTLSQLEAKYPHGKYWNGGNANSYTSSPCNHHGNCSKNGTDYSGWCGCNSYKSKAIQCHGFAYQLAYLVYGGDPYSNWSPNYNSSALNTLKAGDVVRYQNKGHSIFVVAVNGDTVTYADCNSDGHCKIRWNQKISKSTLKSTFTYVDPAPYEWNTGTTHNTHSYSGYYWDSAHPHKAYKKCSCGAKKYLDEYYKDSSCAQCNMTVDTKYKTVKGFKAYPCVTSDFEVKTSNLSTRAGEIYTTDFCTINELYTNGWCKVTFPMDSGGTKTAYTQISKFIKSPSTALTKYTATEYINLYSTSSLSTQIYRIYPGDVCYTIGKSGSATQIFMPMSDKGYYVLGWAVLPPAPESCGYNVPFKCRVRSTSKVKCYNDVNFTSSPGYIYPEDDCVITAVYSNGKVKCTCPWSDGTTKTVYVNKSVFINSSTTPVNTTAPKYAKTYYRSDMATNVGWIDVGDKIQIVATSGSNSQIIYPADVGKRCAWVATSALTQTYTVKFNANGGSGAPSNQTKTHGKDLKLSATIPTRTGHTFVGWATSSTATSAKYSAGSYYTDDKAITLYAVWRKQNYTITYNANGGVNAPASQTQTYGTAITVTSSVPEKDYTVTFNANGGTVDTESYSIDCTFANWNTKKDATGTTVKSGASYTPNANSTLYAVYSNPNLGSYPIPYKEGYTFSGWYTATSGGTQVTSSTVITADTTLYALWELEEYSIIYFDDGSENIPSEQTKTYGTDITLSSDIPVNSGYSFMGWATEEGSTNVVYSPGDTYSENSWVILYPVWEKNGPDAAYKLADVVGNPGDTIEIVLSISNNSGIISLRNNIIYDESVLELISIKDTGLLSGYTTPSPTISSPYTLRWADSLASANNTSNGTIAKLSFKIKADAKEGEYPISVEHIEARNVNGSEITFVSATSVVTIEKPIVKEIVGIEIESLPSKTTYYENEKFDKTGLLVNAVYNTGDVEPISTYTLSGYSGTVGKNIITVTYKGLTTSFTVNVIEKEKQMISLKVVTPPVKISYYEDEEFDGTGMIVAAIYDNGDIEAIKDYTVTGFDSTIGEKTITVTYNGFKTTFTVEVLEKPVTLTGISILNLPNKLEYEIGEELDIDGLLVVAVDSDNGVEVITDYTISKLTDEIGVQIVTVSYKGFSKTFEVIVSDSSIKPELIIGDVDDDGRVTIIDATFIQRHIAQLTTIDVDRLECADTDKDGKVSIIDATMIQRFIAQLIPSL